MADLKKVIKGLEHCTNHRLDGIERCVGCPYENQIITCRGDILEEALELLKAQEKTKVIFSQDDGSIETVCGNCGYGLDKTYSVCPKCGKELDWNG